MKIVRGKEGMYKRSKDGGMGRGVRLRKCGDREKKEKKEKIKDKKNLRGNLRGKNEELNLNAGNENA